MIHVYTLENLPDITAETMFRDRAEQFGRRQGWDVQIDERGYEQDQYDDDQSFYLVKVDEQGRHLASARLRSTNVPCMANEHFLHSLGGAPIEDPRIFEVTRFLSKPDSKTSTQDAILVSAFLGELGAQYGWEATLGIFDPHMLPIYARQRNSPEVLCEGASPLAGLWTDPEKKVPMMCEAIGVPRAALQAELRRIKSSLPDLVAPR